MSAMNSVAAFGGQHCVHNSSWRWSECSSSSSAILSVSWRLKNPAIQLRKKSRRPKCMAFADEEQQVKVLDTDAANAQKASVDSSSKDSSEVVPLLKPSPKPVVPPARPKPSMPQPINKPVMPQQTNGASNVSQVKSGFNTVYRPQKDDSQGAGVQNLDRILQNAQQLENSTARPMMRRQQSFQQPQQGAFQTRWKKGDPVTPINGAAAKTPNNTVARPTMQPRTFTPQQPQQQQRTYTPQQPQQQQQRTYSPQQPQQQRTYTPQQPQQQQQRTYSPQQPQQQRTYIPQQPPQQQQWKESTTMKSPQSVSPSTAPSDLPSQIRTDIPAGTTQAQTSTPAVKKPILNSPPLLRPQPVTKQEPQMLAKPIMTPKPTINKGPRLVDSFRKDPPPKTDEPIRDVKVPKQPVLRDIVTGPATPTTRPPAGKRDEKRTRKSDETEGVRRRLAASDENAIDDAEEIGVNISGISPARKGRKYARARRKAERAAEARAAAPVRVEILEVGKQGMSVGDLAAKLAVSEADVVKALFMKGIAVTINQMLDEESVKIVCNEYNVEVIEAGSVRVEEMAKKQKEFLDEEDLENLQRRPPVVTVMGHVDHGKTSLLDYIRKSKVAAGEAGGITQGIGAYQVQVNVDGEDQTCVFLDTPGHQAFSAMRARGARVTDIAIIVVAADDGTRPQTLESIAHAKAANVPIVVAINKIDKPGANIDRVKEELAKVGVVPPEWGGEEQMVPVSALTGENIDTLLETAMLVAELQDLKSNPSRKAIGTVIEASLDKYRGPLATLLVQNGTLRKGDVVLSGESYGKVRALFDDRGQSVDKATPSTAVQVIGLNSVPIAGDEFEIRDSIDEAREIASEYAERNRETRLTSQASEGKVTLASLASAVASSKESGFESHQLNIVLKVDVQGTVEAIREALQVLPQDTVQLRFLMQAAGDITSSDVDLAIASGAIVIGFNVGMQPTVKDKADSEGVEIRLYKVIYELIDDMRQAMEGLLKPIEEEVPIGKAEVRATFTSGSGRVAGCMVTEGKLTKGCGLHVKRGKRTVYTSTLTSLRRVKEMAKEVDAGLECGVGVEGYNEWQEGDVIEAFNKVEKKRTLEDASATVTAALATKKL